MPFVFAEYSLVLAMASVRRTPACLNACQVIDRRLNGFTRLDALQTVSRLGIVRRISP